MSAVIGAIRYRTDTATLLAHDAYWDGRSSERYGRNTFLYRTPNGRFFAQYLTLWEDERDRLEPLSEACAREMYEQLDVHEVDYEDAFPGIMVEDA